MGTGLLGDPAADTAVRQAVARAVPPFERAGYAVAPGGVDQHAAGQARRWLHAATGDPDGPAAAALLARLGLSTGALAARFAAVRLGGRLPDWARALVTFLRAQPERLAPRPGREHLRRTYDCFALAAAPLLGPLDGRRHLGGVAGSRAGLGGVAGSRAGLVLAGTAHADLARQLSNRLVVHTAPALDFELGHLAPEEVELTRTGWVARLHRLPGLAYVVGTTCLAWRLATRETLRRLDADLPRLRDELWRGADPGPLVGFAGDAGDLHAGGRSVARLRFDSGAEVMYKPRDLRGAEAFHRLTAALREYGLPLALPGHRVLARPGYGWEEVVLAGPCADTAGPGRFYRRMGMLIRLLQLLEGRDFWLDNLIAAGDEPHLIDLETLLSPRAPGGVRGTDPVDGRLAELLAESVLPTGAVTSPHPVSPGWPAEELGALAPLRDRVLPYRPGLSRLQAVSGELDLAGEHLRWTPPPTVPRYGDRAAEPAEYTGEVLAGYRDMQRALSAGRAALAAPVGPLAELADLPVRYLHRTTWEYLRLLRTSLGPAALASGSAREIVLARLYRRPPASALDDRALTVAGWEIDALRRLDIPLFLSRPGSRAVSTSDGRGIDRYFDTPAWSRLRHRLTGLDTFPCGDHEAILRGCLEMVAHAGRRHPAATHPAARPAAVCRPGAMSAAPSAQRLRDAATAIGDELLRARIGDPGTPRWLALRYTPAFDMLTFGRAEPDLLAGTGALALFFAELAAVTGLPRFATAAHAILAGGPAPARDRCVGSLRGAGARIYLLRRCATLLDSAEYRGRAERLAATLCPADWTGSGTDLATGRSGLLLSLLGLPEAAGAVAALVAELAGAPADGYPTGATALAGLPGAGHATALALTRAGHRPGMPARDPAGPGEALALLGIARATGEPPPAGALRYLAGLAAGLDRAGPEDLVHTGELALAADTGDGYHLDLARRAAGRLIGGHEATGRWLPGRIADDRHLLSIVDGLPAVGRLMLRAADPGLPSVRLADDPAPARTTGRNDA